MIVALPAIMVDAEQGSSNAAWDGYVTRLSVDSRTDRYFFL